MMDRRNKILLGVIALLVTSSVHAEDVLAPADERFESAGTIENPDFRRHVLPLFSRLGCNGRACHGSFQGQGGFRLSLFGYDLKADHEALLGGDSPRVNRAVATDSLILQKPTLAVDHEGGERLKVGTWQYHLLRRWIDVGAEPAGTDDVEFKALEVSPPHLNFAKSGDTVALRVTARWTDGTKEDVTPLCRFRTNDESIATIDEHGTVTSVHPGDTHVVAFYDNGVQPVEIITPVNDLVGERYPQPNTPTKIDKLVVAKLRQLGLVASDVCSDTEFLRRATLDMTGVLPIPDEVDAFLADSSTDKRARKVDELLERPTYAAWWTTHLCDYTGNNAEQLNEQPFKGVRSSAQWYTWIYQRVKENLPYDELMARIILSTSRKPETSYEDYGDEMGRLFQDDTCAEFAEGDSMPFFWMRRNNRKPEDMAQSFAHAFLGIRIQCAQCHKHPFDQWTKQDYEQFTVFFNRVKFGIAPEAKKRYDEISAYYKAPDIQPVNLDRDAPRFIEQGLPLPWREVFIQPIAKKPNNPNKKSNKPPQTTDTARFLDGDRVDLSEVADPRQLLVDWLRQDAERYFARSFVNRVWANYFHRGIVEPPDDFNRANPPSNAALLDYLTHEFVAHKFDMKWLHREIVLSRTYQLSSQSNETNALDTRNFSRAVPRRLPAEVAYNALTQATARTSELPQLLEDPNRLVTGSNFDPQNKYKPSRANYALSVFGRPSRLVTCDCERTAEPTLLQTLYLQNDGELLGTIERPDGWLKELMDATRRSDIASQLRKLDMRIQARKNESYQLAFQLSSALSAKDKGGFNRLKQRSRDAEKEIRNLRDQKQKMTAELQKIPEDATALDDAEVVRQAYLRTVSRSPTDTERNRSLEYLAQSPDRRTAIRDLVWTLVNTKEFILNH